MTTKMVRYKLTNVGDYTNVERSTTDDHLIEMWIHKKRSPHTQDAYRRDITFFRARVQKPIQALLYSDLQSFSESLVDSPYQKASSQARLHNAVKSLFSFAMKLGYIRMNPAAMLDTPKVPGDLAARILTEEQVLLMFALEQDERNQILLRLLYESAARVSELCALTWANLQTNAKVGGQITVHGKGDKKRSIPISRQLYEKVLSLRNGADYDEPVFVSRQHGPLTRVRVFTIVSTAAKRADIPGKVSPHWLRHAHASHALDRHAPIQLVKETLGHANIATTNNYAHAKPSESSSTYLVTFSQ